ncbi:MAG: magnesium transporter CorA family protein [Treponemataceae bacterium]|nr:magnesium transporter CorA family protein [Treponemataceae bacterium]
MIAYWQQESSGKLVRTKKEGLDPERKAWVDARFVTREDVELLQAEFGIEPDHILDVLDPDELSRLEDGGGYILTILRLPVFDPGAETQYFTVPLGIVIRGNSIITICWTDCEVLKDFSAGRVAEFFLSDFPAFIIRVISRADTTFLRYLKEINRRSVGIQSELQLSVENKEILQLLSLEKSLVYFTTSLKSNQLLLEKFRKTRLLSLDTDDMDWLDDVEIDNRQAIEMADTYRNVLVGILDAFSSIISNNLNNYMKKLAILNIIMMVPTFITSFFGMNFPLPFERFGRAAILIISLICLGSIFVTNSILNMTEKRFPSQDKEPRKKQRSEKQKERRAQRRLKSIEAVLQE